MFALPNFKYNNAQDRYLLYGFESRFKNLGSPTNARIPDNGFNYFNINQTGAPNTELTQLDIVNITGASGYTKDTDLNDGGMGGTGTYAFAEYGRYDIELENFGYWYDDVIDNSASDAGVDIISSSLQIQLQTVGELSWNTIQEALIDTELTVHSIDAPNSFPNAGERKFSSLNLTDILIKVIKLD